MGPELPLPTDCPPAEVSNSQWPHLATGETNTPTNSSPKTVVGLLLTTNEFMSFALSCLLPLALQLLKHDRAGSIWVPTGLITLWVR